MKFKVTSNIQDAVKVFINLPITLEASVKQAMEQTVNYVETTFKEKYLSGKISQKTLAKSGHPFAARHFPDIGSFVRSQAEVMDRAHWLKDRKVSPKADIPLTKINIHTGSLLSSVGKTITSSGMFSKTITGRVFVDTSKAKHAIYVFYGTKKLIARPLHALLLIQRINSIRKIFNTSFRGYFKFLFLTLRTIKG